MLEKWDKCRSSTCYLVSRYINEINIIGMNNHKVSRLSCFYSFITNFSLVVNFSRCRGFESELFCEPEWLKMLSQIGKQTLPGHHFVADLCLPGKTAHRFFEKAVLEGDLIIHRTSRPDAVKIESDGDEAVIRYTDPSGRREQVKAQLVVLATGMQPPEGTRRIAQLMDIALDDDGFFMEAHPVTSPVESSREGLYLVLLLSAPMVIAALVIGVVTSVLQAVTQLQDCFLVP